MRLIGTLLQDGKTIESRDGRQFELPVRGTSRTGFPQVLIDAQRVGGDAAFRRQSAENWIGYDVEFVCLNGETGFNYDIMPAKQKDQDK
jgi:hypothetical protein